jgi:enterochelin esterase-like enzyme
MLHCTRSVSFLITFALASPVLAESESALTRQVIIHATVPTNVGTVFVTGNMPQLGSWDPAGIAMSGTGSRRTATFELPNGVLMEYKFTLGTWDREGLGPSGTVLPNHRLLVDDDKEVTIDIPDFRKGTAAYLRDWEGSGVLGELVYWTNVTSKHLDAPRHVGIWLPPGYHEQSDRRHPVLYMHDGQNLFDPRIANTGVDWGVDEAIVRGMKSGRLPPAIVVGVWCTAQRGREYSPWDLGPDYARFLIEELMPRVNSAFRTQTQPGSTAVMGSSLGGLISFYLCRTHPEVFGLGGCLSTHFPYSASTLARFRGAEDEDQTPLIKREISEGATFPSEVRLYLDYGTLGPDAHYESITAVVADWLEAQGLKRDEDFVVRKFADAEHNEAAWRARLDEPLEFLFGTGR